MVDRYTKVILTIIAAALVILVAQNAVGTSAAQRTQGCGIVSIGQPPCSVTWSNPLPVVTVSTLVR